MSLQEAEGRATVCSRLLAISLRPGAAPWRPNLGRGAGGVLGPASGLCSAGPQLELPWGCWARFDSRLRFSLNAAHRLMAPPGNPHQDVCPHQDRLFHKDSVETLNPILGRVHCVYWKEMETSGHSSPFCKFGYFMTFLTNVFIKP